MEFFAEITGLLIMAAVSLRATLSAYRFAGQKLQLRRTDRHQFSKLSARVSSILEHDRKEQTLSWTGKRPFQVIARHFENEDESICSFYLVPYDNRPLPSFRPGQFLTLEVPLKNDDQPAIRCYSISSEPTEKRFYRITVRRIGSPGRERLGVKPGVVSNWLHDRIDRGNVLNIHAPSGTFHLSRTSTRPMVLIAGGVGITPMMSMLTWLTSVRSKRQVWLFYGVRNRADHAFRNNLKLLSEKNPNIRIVTFYSRATASCQRNRDFNIDGHVTVDVIRSILKNNKAFEFYVCGPASMMKTVTRDLTAWGVPGEDIKFEAFGPASVPELEAPKQSAAMVGETPAQIQFAKSKKTVPWTPGTKSLLDLAEASGINPRFGCRSGNCGTCMSKLRQGEVEYVRQPQTQIDEGSCLICISRPKGDVVIDL